MVFVLALILGALALIAAGFAVVPVLRRPVTEGGRGRRLLLIGAVTLAVSLGGLGLYAVVGQPQLALETLTGPNQNNYRSLISALAREIRYRPNDVQGWTLLGRGYLSLGDAGEAVAALSRAVDLARAQSGGHAPATLLVAYGQALTAQAGAVNDQAEAAFREAHQQDPQNPAARYFLGYAAAQRGDTVGALKMWQNLAADAPADAPWREDLIAQMAALKAGALAKKGGGGGVQANAAGPPNVQAMVAGLASRLDAHPHDINGWLMLIRAYAVLGDTREARAALTKARAVFAGDSMSLAALARQAQESGLDGGGATP